jgi:hypothetical protein
VVAFRRESMGSDPEAVSAPPVGFMPQLPSWGGADLFQKSLGGFALPDLSKLPGLDALASLPGAEPAGDNRTAQPAATSHTGHNLQPEACKAGAAHQEEAAPGAEAVVKAGRPPSTAHTDCVRAKAAADVDPSSLCYGLGPLKRGKESGEGVVWLSGGTRWAKKPSSSESADSSPPQRRLPAAEANLLSRTLSRRSDASQASSASTAKAAKEEVKDSDQECKSQTSRGSTTTSSVSSKSTSSRISSMLKSPFSKRTMNT